VAHYDSAMLQHQLQRVLHKPEQVAWVLYVQATILQLSDAGYLARNPLLAGRDVPINIGEVLT